MLPLIPATISDTTTITAAAHFGPFIDGNGNVYVVIPNNARTLVRVEKNTNPDWNSFSIQNAAGQPTTTNTYTSIWAYQAGTTLHVVTQQSAVGNRIVQYHSFNTSDAVSNPDTWITVTQTVATVDANAAFNWDCAIALRSDNDRIVLHQGPTEKIMGSDYSRIVYSRWEGSSWTSNIAVGSTGDTNNQAGASIVRGASDKMYFAWEQGPSFQISTRSLNSSNTLGTLRTTSATSAFGIRGKGSYANNAGTEEIAFCGPSHVIKISNDGVPTIVVAHDFAQADAKANIATDQLYNRFYLSYVRASDSDLYFDYSLPGTNTWLTDRRFNQGSYFSHSSNIYYRKGKQVLGYLAIRSGGVADYNEFILEITPKPLQHHHTADSVAVTERVAIGVTPTKLRHTSDSVTVTEKVAIGIIPTRLSHITDSVVVTERVAISVTNNRHNHVTDGVTLSLGEEMAAPITLITVSGTVQIDPDQLVFSIRHPHNPDLRIVTMADGTRFSVLIANDPLVP